MSRVGLIGSSTLLGAELKTELGKRSDLWSDMKLLTFDQENLGKVSEIEGAATFVTAVSPETLDGLDLVVVAGERAVGRDLEAEIPGKAIVIVVSPDSCPKEGVRLVEGVNLADGKLPDSALGRRLLVSPQPAAIVLSLLLHSVRELGAVRADGHLLLPASSRGQDGLDELLAQSRGLLAFQPDLPREIFGRQLAFNLLPSIASSRAVLDDVTAALENAPNLSVKLSLASIFHGCALELHLAFEDDSGLDAVREALGASAFLNLADDSGLGPIDSAGRDDIQISCLAPDGSERQGGYWLSAFFDNLSRGGALNAVAIVEALSTLKTH